MATPNTYRQMWLLLKAKADNLRNTFTMSPMSGINRMMGDELARWLNEAEALYLQPGTETASQDNTSAARPTKSTQARNTPPPVASSTAGPVSESVPWADQMDTTKGPASRW